MNISEISACFIEYRVACKLAEQHPDVLAYQYKAARAYIQLLAAQAIYQAEVKA